MLQCATTWMNPEDIMLIEISQMQKDRCGMSPLRWSKYFKNFALTKFKNREFKKFNIPPSRKKTAINPYFRYLSFECKCMNLQNLI